MSQITDKNFVIVVGGVQHQMQSRADQSEAMKPKQCQPIRVSETEAMLSAVTISYTKPPITSYFSDGIRLEDELVSDL